MLIWNHKGSFTRHLEKTPGLQTTPWKSAIEYVTNWNGQDFLYVKRKN